MARPFVLLPALVLIWISPCLQLSEAATETNLPSRFTVSSRWIRDFGALTPGMLDQLRTELWMQVATASRTNTALLLLSPREVISARKKYPDIPALAGMKMLRIQHLTLGTAPEFVEVGMNYALFYEGVARGSWDVVLRWRLKRADDALEKLTRQTLARKIYLDEFEKEWVKDSRIEDRRSVEYGISGAEKSRMESYLDEAEKRFDKP